jgi:hypothetical protein
LKDFTLPPQRIDAEYSHTKITFLVFGAPVRPKGVCAGKIYIQIKYILRRRNKYQSRDHIAAG